MRATFCLIAALSLVACGKSGTQEPGDMGIRGDAGGGDLLSLPPGCSNGAKDGDETDVDCGGSCAPCAADKRCSVGPDCVTGSCVSGYCALVSGPPNWLPLTPMSTPRGAPIVLGSPDGRIWAISGATDGYGDSSGTSEIFTPSSNQWVAGPTPVNPTNFGAAGAVGPDGNFYISGGLGGAAQTDPVQILDPLAATPSWTVATGTISLRSQFGMATSVARMRIYVFGGLDGLNRSMNLQDVESAGPGATSFTLRAQLPAPAQTTAATGSDGLIYVLSGGHGYVYDPAKDSFSATPIANMATSASGPEVGAPDGRIYVIGSGNPVQAYTPSTNSWSAVANTTAQHQPGGAAVGADGRIYLAGGLASGNPNVNHSAVWSNAFEAYGPILTVTPASAKAGSSVEITGSNFAAGATVRIYLDTRGGTPLAAGKTDAAGAIVGSIALQLPAGAGQHAVIAVDDHSQYPVRATLVATP